MTTAPPAEIWVRLKSHDPAVVNRPTQVPTKDCKNIDDFIDAIKKKLSNKLGQVSVDNINLHTNEDAEALRPGLALSAIPSQPGFKRPHNDESPLFVTIPPPAASSSDPLLKSHRQKSFRKMAVATSCSSFLDAVAKELRMLYHFDFIHKRPTIDDVLRAKRGVEGKEWSINVVQNTHTKMDYNGFITTVLKDTPLTLVKLPDFFTEDEWTKLSKFNDMINHLIHDSVLPDIRMGTDYVILPHAEYTEEMIDFLQTIGVKASLFPYKSWLEVKDEDTL